MITIIPPKKGLKHPLLFRRPGELSLPAFLQLDVEKRVVTFGYWERNTEPKYVTLGHALWWQIDPRTSRIAAAELANEFQSQLERMCDGYSVDWNGHDHIGCLDADADSAAAELTARLSELETQN